MEKREPTPLRIWLQIAKSSAYLEQAVNSKLRETYGQSLSRFDVLSQFIRMGEDELNVGTLSKELIASSGNISRLLDRMEKDGLIARRHSEEDRRSVFIRITKTGHSLFAAMASDHHDWITQMLAGLPSKKQAKLSELLKELQTVLEKRL